MTGGGGARQKPTPVRRASLNKSDVMFLFIKEGVFFFVPISLLSCPLQEFVSRVEKTGPI